MDQEKRDKEETTKGEGEKWKDIDIDVHELSTGDR